jgi:hypothetical protein
MFPYIGPEMIESFLALCGRERRSSREQPASQLSQQQAAAKSTEGGMKWGSVEGTIVRVKKPGAPLEIDQTEFPYPIAGQARLRVEACGICQTDAHLRDGLVPGMSVCLGIFTEPIGVTPIQLIMQGRFIVGAPCGTASDLEDTLQFATLSGVRPMVERFPLAGVADAFDRLLSGKARFRVVLEMDAEPVESRNRVPFPCVHAGELLDTREAVSLCE